MVNQTQRFAKNSPNRITAEAASLDTLFEQISKILEDSFDVFNGTKGPCINDVTLLGERGICQKVTLVKWVTRRDQKSKKNG